MARARCWGALSRSHAGRCSGFPEHESQRSTARTLRPRAGTTETPHARPAGAFASQPAGARRWAFGAASKASRWVAAILDQAVGREPVEAGSIIGRRVILHIAQNERDWPTVVEMESWRGDPAGLMPFAAPAPAPLESAPEPVPAQPASPASAHEPPF